MADLNNAFETEDVITLGPNGPSIIAFQGDPSTLGQDAKVGSMLLDTSTGKSYRKVNTDDTDWVEVASDTEDADDYHSGYWRIIENKTVTIRENKQMRVFQKLVNEGTLINDSWLILE